MKIKTIWEFGYVDTEKGVEPIKTGYGIEILLDNEERKSFEGSNPYHVKIRAIDYILEIYNKDKVKYE